MLEASPSIESRLGSASSSWWEVLTRTRPLTAEDLKAYRQFDAQAGCWKAGVSLLWHGHMAGGFELLLHQLCIEAPVELDNRLHPLLHIWNIACE